jgi:hypothetical protein
MLEDMNNLVFKSGLELNKIFFMRAGILRMERRKNRKPAKGAERGSTPGENKDALGLKA